jgi:hypothetical protein
VQERKQELSLEFSSTSGGTSGKERNRRVFDGIESSVPQLFSSLQDVNGLFDAARGHAMPVRASDA